MYRIQCAKEIGESPFCRFCGKASSRIAEPVQLPPVVKAHSWFHRHPGWLCAIGILIVFWAIGTFVGPTKPDDPKFEELAVRHADRVCEDAIKGVLLAPSTR